MVKKILVICTGNSCRSQMAHGFLKQNPNLEVYSAGIETHGVNPRAVVVMKEVGIDISDHTSDLIDDFMNIDFDLIITVCDHAKENCPYFPSRAQRIHHSFPDPAAATGSNSSILEEFRAVRDMIRKTMKEIEKTYC